MSKAGVDRLHFLGICGTFMGGLALLARQLGYRVSGSDQNIYPPMSTLLESQGIEIQEGYAAEHLQPSPDLIVVGNAMVRGMDAVEYMLNQRLPYVSGPQWLGEQVLRYRHVLAVAGTHGKTTTTSMLTWILEQAGLTPGFLVGGVPRNFEMSARLGGERGQPSDYFVIEADEYDTAFFDKRSKFVHYHPRTLILNNLEYDHADIFPDLAAIERQFHHVVRIVPQAGQIVVNGASEALSRVLARGCWSSLVRTGWVGEALPPGGDQASVSGTEWQLKAGNADDTVDVLHQGQTLGRLPPNVRGRHNAENALAAIAAAAHVGVAPGQSLEALASFLGVARRLERVQVPGHITLYDDFAHHPTAVTRTLETLRAEQSVSGSDARLIAVLEPRSNTMRMGSHGAQLASALTAADEAWLYAPPSLNWDAQAVLGPTLAHLRVHTDVDRLAQALAADLREGDTVVLMSNGAFGGLRNRLRDALTQRFHQA